MREQELLSKAFFQVINPQYQVMSTGVSHMNCRWLINLRWIAFFVIFLGVTIGIGMLKWVKEESARIRALAERTGIDVRGIVMHERRMEVL